MIDFVIIPEEKLGILRNKKALYLRKLKNFLDVSFEITDQVEIKSDDSFALLRTKEIVKAFGRGFPWADCLNLVDDEYSLEIIDTTQFAGKSKNRQTELKSRVIGTEGKSKNIIEKYSGTNVAVYGKTVSIIGKWESIQIAKKAVEMILNGSKHGSVFKYLEDNRVV